jgi:hypothetical protein
VLNSASTTKNTAEQNADSSTTQSIRWISTGTFVLFDRTRQWGRAWLFLTIAIALHVIDEALTGFLPLYNSIVESLRESYSWIPLPTFSFSNWLTGLIIGILILFSLSPLVFAGNRYLRPVSYVLGVLMVGNALGHVGASLYWGALAPGVLSSPILLLAALALLVATSRVKPSPDSRAGSE